MADLDAPHGLAEQRAVRQPEQLHASGIGGGQLTQLRVDLVERSLRDRPVGRPTRSRAPRGVSPPPVAAVATIRVGDQHARVVARRAQPALVEHAVQLHLDGIGADVYDVEAEPLELHRTGRSPRVDLHQRCARLRDAGATAIAMVATSAINSVRNMFPPPLSAASPTPQYAPHAFRQKSAAATPATPSRSPLANARRTAQCQPLTRRRTGPRRRARGGQPNVAEAVACGAKRPGPALGRPSGMRSGGSDGAAGAVAVDCADADLVVVLVEVLDRRGGDVADLRGGRYSVGTTTRSAG